MVNLVIGRHPMSFEDWENCGFAYFIRLYNAPTSLSLSVVSLQHCDKFPGLPKVKSTSGIPGIFVMSQFLVVSAKCLLLLNPKLS